MLSHTLPDVESPYQKFTRKPAGEDEHGYLPIVLMAMTDRDGSTLYETEGQRLLFKIIQLDDIMALKQYFSISPWAIPTLHSLPDNDERIDDLSKPFLTALKYGSLGVIQILLSYESKYSGSPIRFKRFGFHLLNEAARWGHAKLVQFFLDNQPLYAHIHDRDWKSGTAILSAANIYSHGYVHQPKWDQVRPEKNESVMNLLLDRGACASDAVAPLRYRKQSSNTVLTLAAQWSSPEMIKRLIESGADIHAGVTQDSCDLGFGNQPGLISDITALSVACLYANFNVVKTLIEYPGVNVHLADSHGNLPLHWATRNKLPDEAKYIPPTMLQEKIQSIIKVLQLLLEIDPSTINSQDSEGNTPLHYATKELSRIDKQYTVIFQFLCERGADASIQNNKRQTPLHTLFSRGAAIEADTTAISILLSHGAKVTDADNDGNTPLHVAAENLCHLDAVSLLLTQGADTTIQNAKQDHPAHIASYGIYWTHGRRLDVNAKIQLQNEMLERIIGAGGAELMNLPNANGKSPKEISQAKRHEWKRAAALPRGRGRGRGRG